MQNLMMLMMALMMLFTSVSAEDVIPEEPFTLIQNEEGTFIEVTGNPSTGYIWTVFTIVGDIVEVTDPEALPADTEEGLAGAPVTYRLQVTALQEGETILVLRYMRPWEMDIQKELPILVNVDAEGQMFFMLLEGMPMEMTAVEIMEADHAALMESETLGQVIATFPADMPLPGVGEQVKIWSNGVMALSFPGRINVLGWETVAPPQARLMDAPAK